MRDMMMGESTIVVYSPIQDACGCASWDVADLGDHVCFAAAHPPLPSKRLFGVLVWQMRCDCEEPPRERQAWQRSTHKCAHRGDGRIPPNHEAKVCDEPKHKHHQDPGRY